MSRWSLFAFNLKKFRKRANLTQQELGEKLCVSQQTIQQWETEKAVPQADRITEIAEVLEVSVISLLYKNEGFTRFVKSDLTQSVLNEIHSLEQKCLSSECGYADKIMLALAKDYFSSHNGHPSCHICLTEQEYQVYKTLTEMNPEYSIEEFYQTYLNSKLSHRNYK